MSGIASGNFSPGQARGEVTICLQPCLAERPFEILDQIFGIFQPDIHPHHAFKHTHRLAAFGADRMMRGGRRMAHQRARIADVVRNVDQRSKLR